MTTGSSMQRVCSHPHIAPHATQQHPPAASASASPATAISIFHIELEANDHHRTHRLLQARSPSPAPPPSAPSPSQYLVTRSISDLQDYTRSTAELNTLRSCGAVQRLLDACKPTSPFEQQLRAHLRQLLPPGPHPSLPGLAAALTSLGYLVQPHCGGSSDDAEAKPPCPGPAWSSGSVHRLQHHSLVCTGTQPPLSAALTLLPHPVLIDTNFKEQFFVQFGNSSSVATSYDCLLMAVPLVFIGTLSRLEVVVTLLAQEVSAAFKQLKRPLPPWRKQAAIMSHWAPELLRDLAKAAAAAAAAGQQPAPPEQQPQQEREEELLGAAARSCEPESASSVDGDVGSAGMLVSGDGQQAAEAGRPGQGGSLVIQRIQSIPGRGKRQEGALAAALRSSLGGGGGGGGGAGPARAMSSPLTGSPGGCAAPGRPRDVPQAQPQPSLPELLAFRFHTVKLGAKRAAAK